MIMLTLKRAAVCFLAGILVAIVGNYLGWSEFKMMACGGTAGFILGIRNAVVDAMERSNDPGRNNSSL